MWPISHFCDFSTISYTRQEGTSVEVQFLSWERACSSKILQNDIILTSCVSDGRRVDEHDIIMMSFWLSGQLQFSSLTRVYCRARDAQVVVMMFLTILEIMKSFFCHQLCFDSYSNFVRNLKFLSHKIWQLQSIRDPKCFNLRCISQNS